ncbi:MAG: hypothetical protein JWR80_10107 [Bradyrhizobium sp.]|nr:hypothetical protein [Bradyrhizobium sp.]
MADNIHVIERDGLGLATIQARRGVDHERIGKALGIDLPNGPGRVGDARLSAIGTGPGAWFLISEMAGDDWADELAASLAGLAAVFDQSSGYVVLRLSGPNARKVLQAGTPIDLEPSHFGPASSASTSIAHIVVLIWRSSADVSFDLAFYRSYRESLEHWLSDAVAAA